MKIVDHNLPYLEQINTDHGRFYKTPSGSLYPSVTTILSSIPSPELMEWRERVGDKEADLVSRISSERGSFIHECCENHILGKPNKFSPYDFIEKPMFENMIPHLDKFDEVHCLETRLFSDKFKVAGTVDCIAKIDGVFYVVDYKTSKRVKYASDISSYFMQCAFYGIAFYEQTGIVVSKIRIIMTTTDYGVLIFDENIRDWIGKFIKLRKSVTV